MRVSFELRLDPPTAFDVVLDELRLALGRVDIALEPEAGGRLFECGSPVGRVIRWNAPDHIVFEWSSATGQTSERLEFKILFEPSVAGTLVVLEQSEWNGPLNGDPTELAGWFAGELIATWLAAMTPRNLGDWITDRRARRPSGPLARATYSDPLYHRPNFLAILDILQLRPDDFLLEVGCGGGALLKDVLQSGCRAAAIDHSADMVRTASAANRASIEAGRLEILHAGAKSLPFSAGVFTRAVMTGVFGFIDDPGRVLSEIVRVLAPDGQLVLYTATKELLGTPAAPEPIASRLHFYEDEDLLALAHSAGFRSARIDHPDFESLARTAGIPEEHIPLFRNRNAGQLLVASKGPSLHHRSA